MTSEQSMVQTIAQAAIDAAKAAKMAVRKAEGPTKSRRLAQDKYDELNNFKIEVRNIFKMNCYNIEQSANMSMIMFFLGCQGLIFVQTLTNNEQ